ncbi:hypothetical protein OSB04_012006 [Centaurea solstitialis]|uniref:Dihydrolipoyl dehydrogenase n=1 Tax=Centaurea solstitialis TaxID=347529 RepID=A0AA38WDJ3_9ASTR|nr:hypothetical protein OSB04_012006 [Centaurea solstitialis]
MPPVSDAGEFHLIPLKVIDKRMVKKKNRLSSEVLVQWSNDSEKPCVPLCGHNFTTMRMQVYTDKGIAIKKRKTDELPSWSLGSEKRKKEKEAVAKASGGLKNAIIEGDVVGGTCVNRGCVPSKALLALLNNSYKRCRLKVAQIFDRATNIGRDPQLRLLLGFSHK